MARPPAIGRMPIVAYAEARKYTSNVVKVYSPNATWAKVKAAVVGASIVDLHGPRQRLAEPVHLRPGVHDQGRLRTQRDGRRRRLQQQVLRRALHGELDLAPGAIVLLHHLCYASGNSEPGNAEPSVTVARQRADNYAAGFLKAGASAVIADGHAGAERYLRALFTTHQSIEDMWRTMPNRNGNVVKFASTRTPGVSVFQDPITPTSGFYRSLAIGTIGVTTDEVVSAGYGDTGAEPDRPRDPRQRRGLDRGRRHLQRPGHPLGAERDASRRDARSASSTSPTRRPRRAPTLVAGRRASTTRRSAASWSPPTSHRATARRPIVRALDPGATVLAERRRPGRHDHHQRPLHRDRGLERCASRNAGNDVLFETTGTGSDVQAVWDGLVNGAAGPGRHLHGDASAASTAGTTPRPAPPDPS